MGRLRFIGRRKWSGSAVALVASGALLLAACTDGTPAGDSLGDNGVVGTTQSGEPQPEATVELLPYDESDDGENAAPVGPDADDDAIDDQPTDPAPADESNDDVSPTTVAGADDNGDGGGTTLGSIVPPEEAGPSTTEAATAPTDAPVNGDVEQPAQAQDSALACATVELGYLQQLGGNDGSERLRDGAAMAIDTGVNEYVVAGQGLVDALDAGSGIDGAADALLAQCETDGFERLA